MRRATKLVHHPGSVDEQTGAVSPPIYQVSTFRQDAVDRNRGYSYSRGDNPTRQVLEAYVASLEEAEHGFAFSSGMAAVSACLMLLKAGEHVIVTRGLYGGTYRVLTRVFDDLEIGFSFVDTGAPEAVEAAFRPETRAVFVETPSNPLMQVTDIAAVSDLAHARDALVMVDNTFMSPWLQRPLEHGADVVVHSATKFLGGHSDVILGLVATDHEEAASSLHRIQSSVGAVPSPFDCWLVVRGMKTLGVRMEHGQSSAAELAEWLETRSEVESIYYPREGLVEGAEAHGRQADGAGAMLSFRLRDGLSGQEFVNNTSTWTLAVSLGAVESIITLPRRMTHLPYPRQELDRLGIDERLVRLSVGVEHVEDLKEGLADGFRALDRSRD